MKYNWNPPTSLPLYLHDISISRHHLSLDSSFRLTHIHSDVLRSSLPDAANVVFLKDKCHPLLKTPWYSPAISYPSKHWLTSLPTTSQLKHPFLGEAFSDFPWLSESSQYNLMATYNYTAFILGRRLLLSAWYAINACRVMPGSKQEFDKYRWMNVELLLFFSFPALFLFPYPHPYPIPCPIVTGSCFLTSS